MPDITAILDLVTRGGIIGILTMALLGGWKGWYVWGKTHETEIEDRDKDLVARLAERDILINEKNDIIRKTEIDRDYWRDMTMRVLTTSERAVSVVDSVQKKS